MHAALVQVEKIAIDRNVEELLAWWLRIAVNLSSDFLGVVASSADGELFLIGQEMGSVYITFRLANNM